MYRLDEIDMIICLQVFNFTLLDVLLDCMLASVLPYFDSKKRI